MARAKKLSDRGLTVKQLLSVTPEYVKYNGGYVSVTKAKKVTTKGKTTFSCKTRTNVLGEKPREHVQTIEILDGKPLVEGGHIKLTCDCDFHKYTCEVALARHGASSIIHSNGEFPYQTNPRGVPLVCIAKGEKVTTNRGLIPIEDVKVGDEVLTLEGYEPVSNAICTGHRAVIEVKTWSGRSVRLTPDHLVYAIKPGDYRARWVEAETLTNQDYIVSLIAQVDSKVRYKDLNPKMVILGFLIAEWGETGYKPVSDKVYAEIKMFAREVNLQIDLVDNHIEPKGPTLDICARYGIKNDSATQRLPLSFFALPHIDIVSLLYGLFTGDGWISEEGNAATYGTSSEQLALDVQNLLAQKGINSRISLEVTGDNDTLMYLVRPTTEGVQRLVSLLPYLRKYDYTPRVYTAISNLTKVVPVNSLILRDVIRNLWFNRLLSSSSSENTRVSEIVGDNVKKACLWIEQIRPGSVIKRTVCKRRRKGGGHKPQSFAPVNLLHAYNLSKLNSVQFTYWSGLSQHNLWEGGLSKWDLQQWISVLPEDLFGDVIKHFNAICKENVYFDRVISIEDSGTSDVYDLTVPGPEHFLINNLVVHNCKHIYVILDKLIKAKQ